MSKLNRPTPPIFTHERGRAKHINPRQQLQRTVMSCLLWEKGFYESGQTVADRIAALVPQCKVEDVAAIAVRARSEYHMRHVPLLLVCEMTKHFKGKIVGKTIRDVIQRADELTEILAVYWRNGRVPLSSQMKQGLAAAWGKFEAYNLAKYNRDGAVKLRDSLFLCHAKPKNAKQGVVWYDLVNGKLMSPDTWEVALSAGDDKKATFERLIAEGKLGYMALLRNLRNMQDAGVDLRSVAEALTMGAGEARVLPYRFIAAARAVPQWEMVVDAAMLLSMDSMQKLPGKTVLMIDHSESMRQRLSSKSDLTRFDAACGLAILLRGICSEVHIHTFAADMATFNSGYNLARYPKEKGYKLLATVPPRHGMALADAIKDSMAWGGTQLGAAVKKIDDGDYSRLIVITDEQSSDSVPDPKGKGYLINIASNQNGVGYGGWTHIDGMSEAVVRFIQEYEAVEMELT